MHICKLPNSMGIDLQAASQEDEQNTNLFRHGEMQLPDSRYRKNKQNPVDQHSNNPGGYREFGKFEIVPGQDVFNGRLARPGAVQNKSDYCHYDIEDCRECGSDVHT